MAVDPSAKYVYCTMFLPDVVIPDSPEAYVKLTENTLRSTTGRRDCSTTSMPSGVEGGARNNGNPLCP